MRGTPSPAAAGLAYIDALRAAEAAAPLLSYALERSRGDRRAAQAEAILHVAEAVSALQEAQTQGALERDAVGLLRQVAVLLAAGICPPDAKPEPEPEPEPDGADSEGGECDAKTYMEYRTHRLERIAARLGKTVSELRPWTDYEPVTLDHEAIRWTQQRAEKALVRAR